MATEWYVERNGEKHGPMSGSKLKQLAAAGKIRPDDLVWKEGMDDWQAARTIKGLLEIRSSATPPPLPKDRKEQPSASSQIGGQLKAGASVLGASAKLAGQLASKQTEKTSILNGSLPKAFAELGKHVYENGEPTSEMGETFTEIKAHLAKVEAIREKSQNQPEATTFSDKAKSLASTTGAAAQTTMLHQQINQQFVALGKTVFENPDEWPDELTTPISDLRQRLSDLDSEIGELKQQVSAQKEAAGQVVSSVAESGRGFLFKSGVVTTSAVLCAPVGLVLVWLHPTWDRATKVRWTAVSVGVMLFCGVIVQMQKSATLESLAQADRLWEAGDQITAVEHYRDVVSNWEHLGQADRSRVFRRVIEFDCDHDNPESARELIERAESLRVKLSLTSPIAIALRDELRSESESHSESTASEVEETDVDGEETTSNGSWFGGWFSGGEKLAAFRTVVELYHDTPERFASSEEREEFNKELRKAQNAFDKIDFDPTKDRDQAKEIIEMFEEELEGRYSGYQYDILEDSVRQIYSEMTR